MRNKYKIYFVVSITIHLCKRRSIVGNRLVTKVERQIKSIIFNIVHQERKKEVPFSMAIGNGELTHECFPNHSLMGTTRMK